MSVVRWEDPPRRHGNAEFRGKYADAAEALRDQPGRWAVLLEAPKFGTAGSLSARIRQGLGDFKPRGAFEAKAITRGGVTRVYARYVGEADRG